jgi:ABC-type Co2+ transport system permease subunit
LDLSLIGYYLALSGDALIKSICSPSGMWVNFRSYLSTKKYSALIAFGFIPAYLSYFKTSLILLATPITVLNDLSFSKRSLREFCIFSKII